jgi:hypothetical protein
MKNLKVGDVVSNGDKRMVLEVLTNTALLSRYDDPTKLVGWFTLDELKNYTPVKPEKTLEEKFREYLFEDNPETVSDEAKHLAQIAEEHYKNKQD